MVVTKENEVKALQQCVTKENEVKALQPFQCVTKENEVKALQPFQCVTKENEVKALQPLVNVSLTSGVDVVPWGRGVVYSNTNDGFVASVVIT